MENSLPQEAVIMLIVAAVALLIGFLIGRLSNSNSSDKAVQAANKELEDYKQSVSEHFGKTADLIDNLTQSYKEVFDHLGASAKTLLTEEQVQKHLASRAAHAVTLTYNKDEKSKKTETKQTEKKEAPSPEKTAVAEKPETPKADADSVAKQTAEKAQPTESPKPAAKQAEAKVADKTSEQKSADLLKAVAKKTGTG